MSGIATVARLAGAEIKIQARSGLYIAYAVMTAFFLLVLVLLPATLRASGFELIVLLDPGFMGFFFAGGLVLLERDQGVLPVILTHGTGFRTYWCAKAVAILALAATVVALLTIVAHATGLVVVNLAGVLFLAAGLLFSIPAFLSLGIALAGRYRRVMDYFIYASLAMLPFMFPLVEITGRRVGPVGILSPVWGGIVLFSSIFPPVRAPWEIAAAVLSLLAWNVIAFRWARHAFFRLAGGVSERSGEQRIAPPRSAPKSTPVSMGWSTRPVGAGRTRVFLRRIFQLPGDVKLLLRDPVTRVVVFAPLPAAAVLGRGLPAVLALEFVPDSVARPLLTHMDNIRSFALLLGVLMYGMLGAFLVLDEKDEGVMPVLRTLPGRPGWFLLRRARVLFALYALVLSPVIFVGGLAHGGPVVFLLSLAVDALALPLMYFGISILAANKVQGLAFAKVLNLFTLPPLLLGALPGRWGLLVGLVPTGWGSLMRLRATTPVEQASAALIGMVYGGVLLAALFRRARNLR